MLKIIKLVFICFISVSINSIAAPSLQDYGNLPVVSMIAISPDGDKVAFRKVVEGKDVLAVTSLSQKKQLMMLDLAKIQPHGLEFLSNDLLYFVVSETQRISGFRGKVDASTGFILDVTTQKIRQLLIPGDDRVYPGQSGLGKLVGLSEDGEYAYMPAFMGTTDLILGAPQAPNYGLIKVKLKSKGKHKNIAKGTRHSIDFFVDNKGNLLAEERYNHDTNEHSIWIFENKKEKELFKEVVPLQKKSFVGLTSDYSYLVFLENSDDTGRDDYYLMNLTTGKISSTGLGKDNADIERVISDSNRVILGVEYSGFSPSYKFFDKNLDARIKQITDQFPEQSVYLASISPDWKHIVVKVEGSQYAEDYFLFSSGSDAQFLTTGRPNINPEDINPIGKVTFTARDGLKIPTLITIPKDKLTAMKNLPAVIYPHGGPESHDTIGFDYHAQALASQGYLVIQPQFRGSDGFGRAHILAGHGEWGKKMQDDLTDAVKFFASKGYIDPQKVCIVGASYGGYAALAGGAFTPDVYKCVVSINGVSNLHSMLGYDTYKSGSKSSSVDYWKDQFGKGDVSYDSLVARSPEKHADKFAAPVLLIHSEDDKIVPFDQSDDMYSALKRKKKSVELIKLKGDNHHLRESETRLQALEATVNFVNKHLK